MTKLKLFLKLKLNITCNPVSVKIYRVLEQNIQEGETYCVSMLMRVCSCEWVSSMLET